MARETTAAAGITDDWSLRVPLLRSARSATEANRKGHVVRDGLEDSQRLRLYQEPQRTLIQTQATRTTVRQASPRLVAPAFPSVELEPP